MPTVIYPAPIFGPVQSRRLGRSLGVNLLPPDGKLCSFDCVYCECGLNADHVPQAPMTSRAEVARELERRLVQMRESGETLDAITYSGNGEPTSHPEFKEIVEDTIALRDRYFPQAKVCLLTNATHIDRPKIYEAIQKLDKACLKLDTVNAEYIELVDRPNARYDLPRIIDIMKSLNGRCVIQTMFMKGEWQGKSVDNTGDEYVLPWLEVVKAVAPSGVDIYTISPDTPGEGLKKASKQELDHIAGLVQSLGIDAHAYY